MTLQERANKYARMYQHPKMQDEARNLYIKIAEEQKQEDIEKACKAHCSLCQFKKGCEERGEFYCFEIEEIKKAMEE